MVKGQVPSTLDIMLSRLLKEAFLQGVAEEQVVEAFLPSLMRKQGRTVLHTQAQQENRLVIDTLVNTPPAMQVLCTLVYDRQLGELAM